MEKMMSRQQLADHLNISVASLDRLVLRGELRAIRLHDNRRGRVLFDPDEVREWKRRRAQAR